MTTGNETLQRFEQAEKHREGLRYVGQPRDDKVCITRYKNGVVVEIIEKRLKADERIRRLGRKRRKTIANFPSKTAKTRAKLAKAKRLERAAARLTEHEAEVAYLNDERTDALSTRHYPSVEGEDA